jgi:beta-galactosidase
MHYWRLEPSAWGPGLDAMRAMGMRVVDTYVPWGPHEVATGVFDFGQTFPRLDVARFLRMVHERGMVAIVRPGPHINAELTYFGLPERVVWDPACQARTPQGNPVMLPMVPVAFPVPSYASEAFHEEVERWFEACVPVLAPLVHPTGPIVMVQVDNEGALYFRDGAYDQDYHPDSIALYRAYLRDKYKRPSALRAAWDEPETTFSTAEPPKRFHLQTIEDLTRHLDWVEYQEHLLATAFERMGKRISELGLEGIPTMHNLPLGEAGTPLNPQRLHASIDLVGLDYYHHATPGEHVVIMRRTTELAVRAEGREVPAFGAEVGAGFPPFFAPHDEKDSLYTLLTALAYGLRGFNLYMAVERDRWIGAPIDPHGTPRPLADVYNALAELLDRVDFWGLRRRAPVRLVIPRVLRRLARVSHAFGPITPAVFQIIGAGFREGAFEELVRDGGVGPLELTEAWVRTFERALLARGVPFAYAGGETLGPSTEGASWIVCATADGLKPEVIGELRGKVRAGCRVTLGPVTPTRDGSWRPLAHAADVRGLELEPLDELARADALVARRIEELSLPTYPVDPSDVHVAVHEDDAGAPRLVFLMNPMSEPRVAKVGIRGAVTLTSVLGESATFSRSGGGFAVTVPARSVRVLVAET